MSRKQEINMIRIIDDYVELKRHCMCGYCPVPEKRYDDNNKEVCDGDCKTCEDEYYAKMKMDLLQSVGL